MQQKTTHFWPSFLFFFFGGFSLGVPSSSSLGGLGTLGLRGRFFLSKATEDHMLLNKKCLRQKILHSPFHRFLRFFLENAKIPSTFRDIAKNVLRKWAKTAIFGSK